MPTSYPNGPGESLGDILAMQKPLMMSGKIWYVKNNIGTDAAGTAGQNREKPLASTAQAITNASDNDIICYLDGHSETLTTQTISKKLCFIAGGLSGGLPTVKLRPDTAGNPIILTVSGTNVEFRNIWFESNTQTNTSTRISVSAAGFRMIGCYVECSGTDEAAALTLAAGADWARIVNTTFTSTATSTSDQPHSAIRVSGAISDLELDGVVINAGTVGFSNFDAFDSSAAAITRLKAQSCSLLLGADVAFHASQTGWFNPALVTGGSKVSW